ncbi:golgin subfamily A member 2-like [Chelonus insularis]|uniref:golgin subfamily A member 2-like n=1 Tax=Chelonus insularis TaxID=460826 RepID=UPI00158DD917|nr:golgin subfamily A member 2-like [Chelonus insularis]
MNKTEKLLAARKKLKEFQLNKGNHHQVVSPPHQHDTAENTTHEINSNKNENTNVQLSNVEHTEASKDSPKHFYVSELNHKNNESTNENVQEKMFYEDTLPDVSDRNLLDFSQDVPETPKMPLMLEINSNCNNNNEPQPTNQNGKHFDNEMIVQNAFQLSPFLPEHTFSTVPTVNSFSNSKPEEELLLPSDESENQNKNLNKALENEKDLVDQLNIQLNQYKEKISELESCLAAKNTEFETKIAEKVNHLQEQIQFHSQTTSILVSEKAELNASLAHAQTTLRQKCNEVEELTEKLNNKKHRIDELDKELHQTKGTLDELKQSHQQLKYNNESLNYNCVALQKVNEEQNMQIAELRQELNIKSVELANLSKALEDNKNSLSLAELKIQQLTNATQEVRIVDNQSQLHVMLEQQLAQLKENLKTMTIEKEELGKHYESYVKQLDAKYENAVQELKAAQVAVSEYKDREESFVQRLSNMEQQYQREKQRAESLLPLQDSENQIKHLTQSMDSLVLEHETLQGTLREKEAEIDTLKEELKELRELRDQNVEISKLVHALESEQLGASRAVSQNEQLKSQLSEMHDAFVTLSNSKLNLTEQLQDERSVGRKLNKELNRVEMERDTLREELKQKDEIIQELEKEKLRSAQIVDQMQHYQAQSYQTRTLQQELQNALNTIEVLKQENANLLEKLNNSNHTDHRTEIQAEVIENRSEPKQPPEQDQSGVRNVENKGTVIEHEHIKDTKETQIDPDELVSEPLMKLEKRFKETIERVAELSDEKQRLEHLVLQLQGETETIGEYITLYQKQRAILHLKAQEREQTFRQLIDQRNQQQVQLHQLKVLVADLLKNKPIDHVGSNNKENSFNTHVDNNVTSNGATNEVAIEKAQEVKADEEKETKEKILELLTEIKDCKDNCSLEPNFHPCLWCSGKLITV